LALRFPQPGHHKAVIVFHRDECPSIQHDSAHVRRFFAGANSFVARASSS
jgi:hypothetical protein